MYVSGKLDPNENVLLDIGTGYYIEKVSKLDVCVPRKLDCNE